MWCSRWVHIHFVKACAQSTHYQRAHLLKGRPYTLWCIMKHHDQYKVNGSHSRQCMNTEVSFSFLFIHAMYSLGYAINALVRDSDNTYKFCSLKLLHQWAHYKVVKCMDKVCGTCMVTYITVLYGEVTSYNEIRLYAQNISIFLGAIVTALERV